MKNLLIRLIVIAIVISMQYSCQKTQEQLPIELSAEYAQGQDGFKYVLTKDEFLNPLDIPIMQLQASYGEETLIADWSDLKANFEDDFSGFLQDIGLSDYENHESFFITNDKQYLYMAKRPYMIAGKNSQEYSSWILLDNIEDSGLIAATRFDAGRVLLKIPNVK
jgi:hypothetical protein